MSAPLLFSLLRALPGIDAATLPSSHRLAMLVLADAAHVCGDACPAGCDRDGLAWPSKSTVARAAGLSVDTAQRVLQDLARAGWIERRERRTAGGGRTSDFIAVRLTGEPIGPSRRGGKRGNTTADLADLPGDDCLTPQGDDCPRGQRHPHPGGKDTPGGGGKDTPAPGAKTPRGEGGKDTPRSSHSGYPLTGPAQLEAAADVSDARARSTSTSKLARAVGEGAKRPASERAERPAPVVPAHPWQPAVDAAMREHLPHLASAAPAVCRAAEEYGQRLAETLTAIRTCGENEGEDAKRGLLMSYLRNQHAIDDDEERARLAFNATTTAKCVTVGRFGCAVVIDEPTVSRHHATIGYCPDGSIVIADESSQNGLFVRGRRVDVATLQDGDTVHLSPQVALVWHDHGRAAGAHALRRARPEPPTADDASDDDAPDPIDAIPFD